MSDKVEKNLFAFCTVALILLVVSLAVPDWQTCMSKKIDTRKPNICARSGLFQMCLGYCWGTSDFNQYRSCETLSSATWQKYKPDHKTVVVLFLVCTGLHFLCCISGIIAALTSKYKLMLLNAIVDFIAAICGIAAMSIYTNYFSSLWCGLEAVYFTAWIGVLEVLVASSLFFAKFAESVPTRPVAGDRTNLV